jgi:hypothetical protein
MCLANPHERVTNALLPNLADNYTRMIYNFMPGRDLSHLATIRRAKRSIM